MLLPLPFRALSSNSLNVLMKDDQILFSAYVTQFVASCTTCICVPSLTKAFAKATVLQCNVRFIVAGPVHHACGHGVLAHASCAHACVWGHCFVCGRSYSRT